MLVIIIAIIRVKTTLNHWQEDAGCIDAKIEISGSEKKKAPKIRWKT